MKYLVNRETKEHKVATPLAESIIKGYPDFRDDWQLVEADSEGWIPWSGGECPLPMGAMCETKERDKGRSRNNAYKLGTMWQHGDSMPQYDIIAYRPILSETAEKEEKQLYAEPTKVELLFDRLKSAIAASESIPGIIAEIDAMLPEGYCVAKREVQPAEDMSDWRNWIEGDLVRAISTSACGGYVEGMVYKIERFDHDIIYTERDEFQSDKNGWSARFFRFHSRPAKVAK